MTDQCSIWAYEEIVQTGYIGKKQAIVLSKFTDGVPRTALEIMAKTNGYLESDRKRISELEAMGFLEKIDVVKCPTTKMKVNRWKFTGRRAPKMKTMRKIQCTHCNGKGIVQVEEYLDL